MIGAKGIRGEKLREDQNKEGYARSLEGKRVERDGDNVKHMWKQVKQVMIESIREVCGSMRVGGGKNPKNVW